MIKKLAEQGPMVVTMSVMDDLEDLAEFAEAFVTEVVVGLRLTDYSETLQLKLDVADVYGVHIEVLDEQDQVVEEQGWYLKVTVRDETLLVISFHRATEPITTQGGVVQP